MSFARAFVRRGCCLAAIFSFVIPAISVHAADKKAKETVAETPSYYGPQPATENDYSRAEGISITLLHADLVCCDNRYILNSKLGCYSIFSVKSRLWRTEIWCGAETRVRIEASQPSTLE